MACEYVYYRAMPLLEAKELIDNEKYINTKRNRGLTYWADNLADASRYAVEDRVIVRIVLERPLGGRQIAKFTHATAHLEYCMPIDTFNKHLCDLLEDIIII